MGTQRALEDGCVRDTVEQRHCFVPGIRSLISHLVFCFLLMLVSSPNSTADSIANALRDGVIISPVQPSDAVIEKLEYRPKKGEKGVVHPASETRGHQAADILVRKRVPYFPYYALKSDSRYVVHPMALGRYLLRKSNEAHIEDTQAAILGLSYELPNGGLAWYYPRHYRVARMLGDQLKYSSISQGTIIAGLTKVALDNANVGFENAEKAFEALLWPFEYGGVNLADRALLEMPSFRGPPELILNGWIDALLHVRDYARISGNRKAKEYFEDSVSFLSKVLRNFDAGRSHTSRYSDVSPYQVRIRLNHEHDVATLNVLYRPKVDHLPVIRVPLNLDSVNATQKISPYDNHIYGQDGKNFFAWISCSQMYDTVIVAKTESMLVQLNSGVIEPRQTTPGNEGKSISRRGVQSEDLRYVELGEGDDLICGYPTNFLKGGTRNEYHVYHVVGLMLVALSPEVSPEDKKTILKWALRWQESIDNLKEKNAQLKFISEQAMLNSINSNRSRITYVDYKKLLSRARLELGAR